MTESLVGRRVLLTGEGWNHESIRRHGVRVGHIFTVTEDLSDADSSFVAMGQGWLGLLRPASTFAVKILPEFAHWHIFKDAERDPIDPWFVEHRLNEDEGHPRYMHDQLDWASMRFPTWEDAMQVALREFDLECREFEETR